MAAPYDLPTNITDYTGMFSYINESVIPNFMIMILIAIFAVPYIILSVYYGKFKAFVASSWLTFISAYMFSLMELVPTNVAMISFALCIISLLLLWREQR